MPAAALWQKESKEMIQSLSRAVCALSLLLAAFDALPAASQIHRVSDETRRADLHRLAHVERQVMVPMRDGIHLASRVYIPKAAPPDGTQERPAIFWRTPYNTSEHSASNPNRPNALLKFALDAVKRGYVFVVQNERGKFYSEGEWQILGRPRTDGYDALTWIAGQNWSNGRVATLGCSSTAEWQMALAAMNHPAHAAAVPMGQGAGIGRMGGYYEMGSFYRGGAIQLPMVSWLYGVQNTQRPTLPEGLSREDRIRLETYFDLAPRMPPVDWPKAFDHLPVVSFMEHIGGPKGVFSDLVKRLPDDHAWYEGGLYHDNEDFGVPALWMNSWYDLSVAPNLALYNHVRNNASDATVRDHQYMVIAPTLHCAMYRLTSPQYVGDMNMGEVDFGLDQMLFDFLDLFTRGEPSQAERDQFDENYARVLYYAMGENRWRRSPSWPPPETKEHTLYLASDGSANSLFGDGRLAGTAEGDGADRDRYIYDPMSPAPTKGGNFCCLGNYPEGPFDQRSVEARADVLVFTSDVMQEPLDVAGPVSVTLFVSSDVKDTDFTVKLIDVYPDGRAFNLDDTILRARYREGFDREVFMEKDEVYEIELGPMVTANVFQKGHRIRLEVSSSNFPRYDRNLNTGGKNWNETKGKVANNVIHHSGEFPSRVQLQILK